MHFTNSPLGLGLIVASCIGSASALRRRQDGPTDPGIVKDCTYFTNAVSGDTCQSIADYWAITKAQFIAYNPAVKSDCSNLIPGHSYCVEENYGNPVTTAVSTTKTTTTPLPSPTQTGLSSDCKQFYKVKSGDTCQAIVDSYGTFTLSNFYSWNPAVGSSCGGLQPDYYVCVGVTGTPTVKPTTSSTSTRSPGPQQTGLAANCNKYYLVKSGDSCQAIVDTYKTFTLSQFYSWNPAVGSDCRTLQAGYYVCVGVPGASTTTATGVQPTQTGIRSDCTKFYKAKSGDTCDGIAYSYGTFTTSQFISWNPAVGSSCSMLKVDYYYCVAIPGTPTTRPATTATPSPGPQQTGIRKDCTKYYKAVSGDTCEVIANRYKTFTSAQFISWNPAVGSGCSSLIVGYYYCIAIPGTPTTPIKTSTPTPTKGPQPQQSGIVSNCNKYYYVKSGQGCYDVEQANGISATNFFKWNTGVKSDCSNLQANTYCCVGVS